MAQIGDTEVFEAVFYNTSDAPFVPTPTPVAYIANAAGTMVVNGTAMTQEGSSVFWKYEYTFAAAGKHKFYAYTSSASAAGGGYTNVVTVNVGEALTAAAVWANATRTLTSGVNLGAIDVTLVEAESYVARYDFTLYKRIDYVTGARAGTVRFRYNIDLSSATMRLVGEFKGRGDGEDFNITGTAAVDPADSAYYIVEFSLPTSTTDNWGTGDKAYLYEVRAYKSSIDDVLQRGWISVPDSPPVSAN